MMETGNKGLALLLSGLLVLLPAMTPGAWAAYSPAEQNPLLGRSVLLDQLTCAQKYGNDFCACIELDGGGYGCYYKRPATGMYTLERCEQIWGAGHCDCNAENQCKLKEDSNTGTPLGCSGQIYIFPGQKLECRKAGIQTMGNSCCIEEDKLSNACSFENTAKTLGWDDAAISMVTTVGGYFAKQAVADWGAQFALNNALASGAFDFATTGLNALFGDFALNIVTEGGYSTLTTGGISYSWSGGASEIPSYVATEATKSIAANLSSAISMVGWAYTIYSMYNMMNEMSKCMAGEKILGCKIAKGVCYEVGDHCAVKIFGACLQKKQVSCCFDSILARIIHEQGRAQLGMGWGDGSSPDCRGFYVDEFMRIDFTKIDFGEYTDDMVRQMLNPEQVESRVNKILDKYQSIIPQ